MNPSVIFVIDNYDSFTYNLVQYLGELGAQVQVARNDAVSVDEISKHQPDGIVISPGPGRPQDAGVSLEVIEALGDKTPILGVCLGHQSIAERFGANIVGAQTLMHGRTSAITHDGQGVFAGLPSPFVATRYHSLVVERASVPAELEITAHADDDEIMGLRHRELPLCGVQFHPESFLTEHGHTLLRNWLSQLGAS